MMHDADPFHSRDLPALLTQAQQTLDAGFAHLPASEQAYGMDGAAAVLAEAATRLHDNFPYAHPLYAGQMLKPPHPAARAAYALAMAVNPNNHALDGGRASSAMEIEAVHAIARMFGYARSAEDKNFLGHLSSGGTFANLEALWVAGQIERTAEGGPRAIAASAQAHYTHQRISAVLGLPCLSVPVDSTNRMDVRALEAMLSVGEIGTVVVTLGTTATGAVDPLDEIVALRSRFHFRIHVDAAYGGYFTIASELGSKARAAYEVIAQADSIVVDPHKHGLQPYGCGCVLFRDPAVGRLYKHDSPYTYFTSGELHLGEISLECSRAGAAAVALWTTQRLLPMLAGGEFAQGLDRSLRAAQVLHARLAAAPGFIATAAVPQLDICVWAVRAGSTEQSSALAQAVFDECARHDLHLALARLPVSLFAEGSWPAGEETVVCLRSVLMKPEHLAWLDAIWERLERACAAVLLAASAAGVSHKS